MVFVFFLVCVKENLNKRVCGKHGIPISSSDVPFCVLFNGLRALSSRAMGLYI